MILLRFMSAAEALKFVAGLPIENDKNHKEDGQMTDSIGACFLGIGNNPDRDETIYESSKILSGINCLQVCLYGKMNKTGLLKLKKGYGKYTTGVLPEFSTTEYDRFDFSSWELLTPRLDIGGFLPILTSANWERPTVAITHKDI